MGQCATGHRGVLLRWHILSHRSDFHLAVDPQARCRWVFAIHSNGCLRIIGYGSWGGRHVFNSCICALGIKINGQLFSPNFKLGHHPNLRRISATRQTMKRVAPEPQVFSPVALAALTARGVVAGIRSECWFFQTAESYRDALDLLAAHDSNSRSTHARLSTNFRLSSFLANMNIVHVSPLYLRRPIAVIASIQKLHLSWFLLLMETIFIPFS